VNGINIPTIILVVAFVAYVVYEWWRLHRIEQAMRLFAQENGLNYDRNGRLTGIFRGRDIIMYSAKRSKSQGRIVTTSSWTIVEADVNNPYKLEFYLAPKSPFPPFLNNRDIPKRLSQIPTEKWVFHIKNNGIQYRQGGVLRDAVMVNHILDLMCDVAEAAEAVEPVAAPLMQSAS
jgi:hypothetical protein